MSLTYEAAERLFQEGEFKELIAASDLGERALKLADPRHQVLLAHALAQLGDVHLVRRLATTAATKSDSPLLQSKAQVALALADHNDGRMAEALDSFSLAQRLATQAKDDLQLAWTRLLLFRHAIDTCTTDIVTGMLSEVRRAVLRAGNVHATAYLHVCIAVLEGQNGRLDEARRHCAVVDSLLALQPNAWIAAGNLLNRTCIALLACDLGEAARFIHLSKYNLLRNGTRFSSADHNLASFQASTGRYEEALRTLELIARSGRASRISLLGVLDERARINLALNRLDTCAATLDRIDEDVQDEPRLARYLVVRSSTVTRARLLLRQQDPAKAVEFIRKTLDRLSDFADDPLKAVLCLVAAQALVDCGGLHDAASALLRCDRLRITSFRYLQAQYYFACGLMLRHRVPGLARENRNRAFRLWKSQGLVSVADEMHPRGKDESDPEGDAQDVNLIDGAIDSLAAAFDLAHSPKLMGAEFLSLIRASRCADGVALVERPIGNSRPIPLESTVAVHLGVHQRKNVSLVCSVPRTPERATVLAAILRLADAAVALERAREEERQRAAFWPLEPAEEQAGGLFIAEEMQSLLTTARRVAPTNVSVLITGETGTGKEVLARTIHAYSNRAKHNFLPFNCTSTPRDMLDSQLFGHRRGSFTGATENFQGVIRAAGGGTLFLDEIGDMPLDVQPKLLRFLESGEVHPIGEAQPVRADVRVIAATNASLDTLVGDGRFREDLFYRLNIVRLHIPPLRERRVEIPTLANHYLHKYAQEYGKGDLRLAEETMEYLVLYRWPGNVRQLANEMRRMTALSESGAVLMPEHLPAEIAASRRTIPASERILDVNEVVVRLDQPMAAATEHLERAMLKYALDKTGGRIEETATLLGVSRKGLYLKRQRFGIDPPEASVAGVA